MARLSEKFDQKQKLSECTLARTRPNVSLALSSRYCWLKSFGLSHQADLQTDFQWILVLCKADDCDNFRSFSSRSTLVAPPVLHRLEGMFRTLHHLPSMLQTMAVPTCLWGLESCLKYDCAIPIVACPLEGILAMDVRKSC